MIDCKNITTQFVYWLCIITSKKESTEESNTQRISGCLYRIYTDEAND